jgi:hypothetical protein
MGGQWNHAQGSSRYDGGCAHFYSFCSSLCGHPTKVARLEATHVHAVNNVDPTHDTTVKYLGGLLALPVEVRLFSLLRS